MPIAIHCRRSGKRKFIRHARIHFDMICYFHSKLLKKSNHVKADPLAAAVSRRAEFFGFSRILAVFFSAWSASRRILKKF